MLNINQTAVVSLIAARMATMMSVDEQVHTRVLPQGLRDPDGSLGIFVVSSQPLVSSAGSPWMTESKKWVMLAVMAAVKYTAGSPVTVDYIGLTDTQGMGSEHWFYKLSMSAARLVQRQLFDRTLTTEQAYEKIAASWHRITPEDSRDARPPIP